VFYNNINYHGGCWGITVQTLSLWRHSGYTFKVFPFGPLYHTCIQKKYDAVYDYLFLLMSTYQKSLAKNNTEAAAAAAAAAARA
jgi:hypothetical protein